ncbi:Uncharacterised protein [Vibrio cholerae]|nr:Uncharacterised protein [Vibrio cholerae]
MAVLMPVSPKIWLKETLIPSSNALKSALTRLATRITASST